MKDLPRRLAVSSVVLTVVAFLVVFAFHPWVQYGVTLFVALLASVAIWEYSQFVKEKGGRILLPVLLGAAFLQVVSFFAASRYSMAASFPLLVFFLAFLVLFALHFRQNEGAIVDIAVSSFGLLYIAVPMGMIIAILFFQKGPQDGRWWIAYLLVATKITDIGAYFVGTLWGRRKLAPTISPGKTIEGAIFGLLCALGASLAFHWMSPFAFQLPLADAIWLGIILGLTSQFGDLSESLLKRDANKKDSNVLPGLGGVLDLVDSLLFNAFIIFIYLNYMKS